MLSILIRSPRITKALRFCRMISGHMTSLVVRYHLLQYSALGESHPIYWKDVIFSLSFHFIICPLVAACLISWHRVACLCNIQFTLETYTVIYSALHPNMFFMSKFRLHICIDLR